MILFVGPAQLILVLVVDPGNLAANRPRANDQQGSQQGVPAGGPTRGYANRPGQQEVPLGAA